MPLVYPDFMANQVTQAPRGAMDGTGEMDSREWTDPQGLKGQKGQKGQKDPWDHREKLGRRGRTGRKGRRDRQEHPGKLVPRALPLRCPSWTGKNVRGRILMRTETTGRSK